MANITQLSFRISSSYDGTAVARARQSIADLSRQLDELSSRTVSVTVNIDTAKLAEVKAQLDAIGRMHETATVDVDTHSAGASLSGLSRSVDDVKVKADSGGAAFTRLGGDMDEAGQKSYLLTQGALTLTTQLAPLLDRSSQVSDWFTRIGGDSVSAENGVTGLRTAVAAATADFGEVGTAAERTDVSLKDVKDGIDGTRTSIQNSTADFQGFQKASSAAVGSLGSLTTAGLALGPAIAPLSVAALGAAGAFTTMAVAGGGAAGVFGLAVMAAFGNASKAAQKLGVDTTAASRSMQSDLNATKASFYTWGGQVASIVQGPVETALNALQGSFSKLTPLVAAVAPEAQRVADAFKNWTNSNLQGWVSWFESNGVPILHNLDSAFMSLGGVFGSALRAFAPLAQSMSLFIAQLAAKAQTWATGGGFDRFVALVQSHGPEIKSFFEALWGALQNVFRAANALGPSALSLATALLKIIQNCPPATIAALVQVFLAFRSPLAALLLIAPGLATALGKIVSAIPPGVLEAVAAAILVIRGAILLATAAQVAWTIAEYAFDLAETLAIVAMYAWDAAVALAELLMLPVTVVILLIVAAILILIAVLAAIAFGLYELITHWTTVWGAIETAGKAVWNALQAAWQACVSAIETAWDAVSAALSTAWHAVWGAIQTAAAVVWGWLTTAWNACISGIETAWSAVSAALSTAWHAVWGGIQTAAAAVWSWITSTWNSCINGVKSAWDTVSRALSTAWHDVWSGIESVAKPIWDWLGSTWHSIINGLKSAWDTVSHALQTAWSDCWNAMKKTATTIWDDIKTAIVTPINFIIGCWDVIAKVIGVGNVSPIHVGTGTPGYFTLAEGGQADHVGPGLVRGPGGPTEDRVPGWLSNDEFVMNAAATKQWGVNNLYAMNAGQTPAFAMAAGGLVNRSAGFRLAGGGDTGPGTTAGAVSAPQSAQGNAQSVAQYHAANDGGFGWVTALVGKAVGVLKNIAATVVYDTVKPLADAAVAAVPNPFMGLPDPIGPMPHELAQKAEDGVLGILKSKQDSAKQAASFSSAVGAIPTGAHQSIIDQAAAAAGVPPPNTLAQWEVGMNTLITRESAWNPNAINNTDSNAQAGHPSQGLAQCIPSTFEAYHAPGTSNNILDPVANVAAAMRYIVATYGGITNVQQAFGSTPKGYWTGTGSAMAGWHKLGENGPEWVKFRGGEQVRHGLDGSGQPVTVEVHHHWPAGVSKDTVKFADDTLHGDEVVRALKAGIGKRPY